MNQDFLVEIGCEELPPKSLKTLESAFLEGIIKGLGEHELDFGEAVSFSTPRRLAVLVKQLQTATPGKEQEVWGPPAKIAFDETGKPTRAAEAFADKNGITTEDLANCIRNDGKADRLCVTVSTGGEAVSGLLPGIVNQSLANLPIAKRMRWGARRSEFVRPVHWVVMLLDDTVVDGLVMDINSDAYTYGHRLSEQKKIRIDAANQYENLLLNAGVVCGFENRKARIEEQVNALASSKNAQAVIDPDLLDEVTALVEWPVALFGRFDESFLSVPPEALVSSMSEHQKYFHLVDSEGKLVPGFITVANLESRDPSRVIDGNERVIRPRLSDAAFFFETDKKMSLEARTEKLGNIVFQQKLGSLLDKSSRIAELGKFIATCIGADQASVERAGKLCKADLASDMVLEFDKMQGIAGYYYALHDGESTAVAESIKQHYLPRFAGDDVPSSLEACAVALADRIDTLVGIFGIGQLPTGSKDPFALRRASIGCLNIIVQHKLDISLDAILSKSLSLHASLKDADDVVALVRNYMIERFRAWFHDEGISVEVFNAVQARDSDRPYDIYLRVHAVNAFNQLEQAQALAAANKRVSNILAKSSNEDSYADVNPALFESANEEQLFIALSEKQEALVPLLEKTDYNSALFSLADLRPVVDAFFDNVMVMADDETLRNNRVALLSKLHQLFMQVADISRLVPEKNHA